jgi:hypothetical protein
MPREAAARNRLGERICIRCERIVMGQVSKMVTNLRYVMIESLRCTRFFEVVLMKKVKRSSAEFNEEKKVPMIAQLQRRKLPISMNMMWSIQREYLVKSVWTCRGIDRQAVWMAIAINLTRVENTTKMQKQKAIKKNARPALDHCMKVENVSFTVNKGEV